MANLRAFRVDSQKINDGDWVSPGEEYDDLEIKTRGFTDAYSDSRAAKMRRAAVPFGGDMGKVPSQITRNITVDCLIKHCLQDVRGLSDGEQPVTFAAFCELLHNPDYPDLLNASIKAASLVGAVRAAEVDEAVPLSGQPSG